MRIAAIALFLTACGSDVHTPDAAASDTCTVPTTYLGVEHDCMGGAGICMADRGPVECFVKCALYPNGYPMACGAGLHSSSQATVDAEVCYCVPN